MEKPVLQLATWPDNATHPMVPQSAKNTFQPGSAMKADWEKSVANCVQVGGNDGTLIMDADSIKVGCPIPFKMLKVLCPICQVESVLFLGRLLNSVLAVLS